MGPAIGQATTGDFAGEMRAVLAAELPFAANDLSVDEAGHFGREARRLLERDEVGDLELEDFLAGVAEHLEAGGVHLEIMSLGVADEDAVGGLFDKGAEPALAGVERLLRLPLLGDVVEHEHHADHLPAASRIGAALSSMGTSRPSLVTRAVWLAKSTARPSRRTRATGSSRAGGSAR